MTDFRNWAPADFDALEKRLRQRALSNVGNLPGCMHAFETEWQAADALEWKDKEIERLRIAGHDAFVEMCAYRDSPDLETFQDAIDALGIALGGKK